MKNKRGLDSPEMNSKKCKFDASNMFFPTPKQFHETCQPQQFPFRMTIMKYIWSNPSSPQLYQKLIKSCKFFFLKNPIFVMTYLDYRSNDGWTYSIINESSYKQNEKIDLKKFYGKIWITNAFRIFANNEPNLVSSIIPRIERRGIKSLKLVGQNLSYDELKFVSFGVENKCAFIRSVVKYDNGEVVPLEDITKLFSGVKEFIISSDYTCKSYGNLVDVCKCIEEVVFLQIPEYFDLLKFYQHLKCSENHALIKIYDFYSNGRYEAVIDKILETQSFEFIPPVIQYFDRDDTKIHKLKEIHATVVAKYR